MTLIQPFRGLHPAKGREQEIAAPPYDVMNSAEARAFAKGKPWSFMHVSKPEIDLPEDIGQYDPAVYAKAAENIHAMIDAGLLVRDEAPCYYVYRLIWGDHEQTGLVAAASVEAYDRNHIRRHEFTRPVKEDDRVAQIEAVAAHTGPVMCAYPSAPHIDDMLAAASSAAPDLDVTAEDGIRHSIWIVSDAEFNRRVTEAFEALPALYIADGHHRSAAASRVCAARAAENPDDMDAPWRRFLSVIFPHHQMKILDYNRVIRDLGGLDPAGLIEAVSRHFTVTESASPVRPEVTGQFGMYMGGAWYRLSIDPALIPAGDPLGRLDINLLSDNLIAPLLGIEDQRTDTRIDFVGGMRGLGELERRVDSGEMALAFSLYPTTMVDLMAVADIGEVMPTKSTWFEPKLADGLVSLPLD
ncbi:MAG: DUF1015 domain-containing protein [Hyphomicrobiales bacterium]|nr:MAG: DUF1015 domain-containing protein [Hyphomicrobiales bacterium]